MVIPDHEATSSNEGKASLRVPYGVGKSFVMIERLAANILCRLSQIGQGNLNGEGIASDHEATLLNEG